VPGAGAMYAGTVGLFSFGGISFDVSRRFLAVAERYVDSANVTDSFFWRIMAFAHHFISGDWSERHEIPFPIVEDALRHGQLWDVATHVGLESFRQLAQGRWRECEARIDWLQAVEEDYAYDLASSNRHAALAFLHTERRALEAAEAAADVYLTSHDETLLNLLALGTKAKVQVLRGDLVGARESLHAAERHLGQRLPPWHFGFVVRSRLLLEVAELELAGARGRRTSGRVRACRRDALWAAARFAWLRPEVWTTVGRLASMSGRPRRALAWYGRALDEAERLGMRPEAARIRLEIGRSLAEGTGPAAFRGLDAGMLFASARQEFEALGLPWDLARVQLASSKVDGPARGAQVAERECG
jgi:hypothetical protein